MIKELIKNLFSKAETLSSEAEQSAIAIAKDYTDTALTKRDWNFTTTSSASQAEVSSVAVENNTVMGTVVFNNVSGSAGAYTTIGTTTDKPEADFVLFPIYNGSNTNYIGVLRVQKNGSVDVRGTTAISGASIYCTMLYNMVGGVILNLFSLPRLGVMA